MTDENDVLGKAPDVMVRLEALWNEVAKTHSLEALQDWRDCIWTAFPNIHAEVKRLRADNARLQKIAEATANLIPRLMDHLPMRNMVSSQTIDAIEQYEQALAGEEFSK